MNQPWIYMCSPSQSPLPPPPGWLYFKKKENNKFEQGWKKLESSYTAGKNVKLYNYEKLFGDSSKY